MEQCAAYTGHSVDAKPHTKDSVRQSAWRAALHHSGHALLTLRHFLQYTVLLMFTLLASFLTIRFGSSNPLSSSFFDRAGSPDPYYGKTLTPTNYTIVAGLFKQSSPDFNEKDYDLLSDSFGLIDRSDNRWHNFTNYITKLNKNADKFTTYKVIYIARHGEGYHNLAETTYGTPDWNCYWSLLNTDGDMTWGPDAVLTSTGICQAEKVNAAWKEQNEAGIPLPQSLYTSPLRRACSTLNITWSDILLNKGHIPQIKEQLRESIGLHTCDKRSNKTVLRETFPTYHFDPSFTEQDEQWNEIYEEQSPQQALRIRLFLNELFSEDSSTFISITAHSGVITGFFTAIGHRVFSVQPGGFVPVIVKAVSYPDAGMAVITGGQSGTAPICTVYPTTSV